MRAMNMDSRPTHAGLTRMIAACKDTEASDKLSASNSGEVHLTAIPVGSNIYPHFDSDRDSARFHLETFLCPGDYTGVDAARIGSGSNVF